MVELVEVRCPCERKKLLGKFKQADGVVACSGCSALISIQTQCHLSTSIDSEDRRIPYQQRMRTLKK